MSDILLYNQILKQNEALRAEIQATSSGGGGGGSSTGTTWDPTTWGSLPMLDQDAVGRNVLCVFNTANFGCGNSCTWTVPAGATTAQFQVWGAGSNGNGGHCCAMGLPGTSGAYATTIISVTPGDTYVLCAGCALCCCIHTGPITGNYRMACVYGSEMACPSYVTGNGLTNFCADGALHGMLCRWKEAWYLQEYGAIPAPSNFNGISSFMIDFTMAGCCNQKCTYSTQCSSCDWVICNISAACGQLTCVEFISECCSTYHGTSYGINGIYPAISLMDSANAFGTILQGRFCHAPVHGFKDNCANWPGPTLFKFGGNYTYCGACESRTGDISNCSWNFPGKGGHPGWACGGGCGGGCRASGGMVRVSWC